MASRFLVFSFFRGCFGQVLFSPFFDYGFQNGAKAFAKINGIGAVVLNSTGPAAGNGGWGLRRLRRFLRNVAFAESFCQMSLSQGSAHFRFLFLL